MKVRLGFVTNSSSSSFIINKRYLDKDQIKAINNHIELSKKANIMEVDKWDYPWSIDENEYFITGYVDMDNFDMYTFLDEIDVNMDTVTWHEYPYDLERYDENSYVYEVENKDWRSVVREM